MAQLEELELLMKKRQPKKCAPLLEMLGSSSIPGDYAQDVKTLIAGIDKYQFKEAEAILQTVLKGLRSRTESET